MDTQVLYKQRDNCTIYKLYRNGKVFFLKYFKIKEKLCVDTEKERLEKAEYIAGKMQEKGIDVINAIQEGCQYIQQKNKELYAIYPWISGESLDKIIITPDICYEVGKVIGKIHKLALKDETIIKEHYSVLEDINFDIAVDSTVQNELIIQASNVLKNYREAKYRLFGHNRLLVLSDRNILCHRDTSPSNFMLCNGKYYMIDWEHAGYEYPEFELFDTCLEWSDYMRNTNWENYHMIVQGYYSEVPYVKDIPYEAILDRMLLSILGRIYQLLLEYNINRKENSLETIKSYILQLSELEINRDKYIENLKL